MTSSQRTRKLLDEWASSLSKLTTRKSQSQQSKVPTTGIVPFDDLPPPPLNIVMHVIGSRGDIQPFISLAQALKSTYGHRIRIATHLMFKDFVENHGFEFFNIGGDPAALMAFMVKNPGLLPGIKSLRDGDVRVQREELYEIMDGCWRSCFENSGVGGSVKTFPETSQSFTSDDAPIVLGDRPFVADVIIANPPSFAHVHCAEKLGIPVHLVFTMPWSPTQTFPHPLANLQSSSTEMPIRIRNFVSYALVETMIWQGSGDLVNRFRKSSLRLEPISRLWAPGMISRLQIPCNYCWSPSLIPKPRDWGSHISVSGFNFLPAASSFTPPPSLVEFLDAGPAPIYIGFGSIVMEDPQEMTRIIFKTVENLGLRALISYGWGGIGGDELNVPRNIMMLGNVPHDWLFKQVSCVVHHGGAGTTAAGIAAGRPTVIIPFFGDQPFWGEMVARAGAGPAPIPIRKLTAVNLAASILEALKPESCQRALDMSLEIAIENGSLAGAESFHEKLCLADLRCSILPKHTAVWRVKGTQIRLSALAAAVLSTEKLLEAHNLVLNRSKEYQLEAGPWDPFSGAAHALMGSASDVLMGIADLPVGLYKVLQPNKKATNSTVTPGMSSEATAIDAQAEILDILSTVNIAQPGAFETLIAATMSNLPEISSKESSAMSSQVSLIPESKQRGRGSQQTRAAAICVGKGFGNIVLPVLKSPMDFSLGIAQGFHNAPKLYGDTTVRPPDKITGISSGLRAAGKEFALGLYDGISGLVTQPYRGARDDGGAGFAMGIGKGIGGFFLKPGASLFGLPAYTFRGIYKELEKRFGSSVDTYIRALRTQQSNEDWEASTEEERMEVVRVWTQMQNGEIRKENKKT